MKIKNEGKLEGGKKVRIERGRRREREKTLNFF